MNYVQRAANNNKWLWTNPGLVEKATDISKMFCCQVLSTVLYLLYFHQLHCYILYSRLVLVRPSGEQLTKLQPGMIGHPVQRDSYSCGVTVIKVGALHCIFYCILHITFFKSDNDGFVTLELATEFLKQLPGTLEKQPKISQVQRSIINLWRAEGKS